MQCTVQSLSRRRRRRRPRRRRGRGEAWPTRPARRPITEAAARIHCVVLTCKISRVDILLPPSPTLIFLLTTTTTATLSPFVVVDVEFRDFITRYCPRFSNATHAQALLTRTWSWSRSRRSAARDLYTLSPPLLFLRCLRHSSLSAINLGSGGTIATCFFGLPAQSLSAVVGEATRQVAAALLILDLGSLFTCNQKRTWMKPGRSLDRAARRMDRTGNST